MGDTGKRLAILVGVFFVVGVVAAPAALAGDGGATTGPDPEAGQLRADPDWPVIIGRLPNGDVFTGPILCFIPPEDEPGTPRTIVNVSVLDPELGRPVEVLATPDQPEKIKAGPVKWEHAGLDCGDGRP